jgi:chromosomal replication initiation ATPase DnaA
MYLAHTAGADSRQIGRRFGGRDHTIVEAVCRNMARISASDTHCRALVLRLEHLRREATQKRELLTSPRSR